MAASGDSASGDGRGDGGDDASTDEVDSGLGTRPDRDGPAATAVLAWVAVAAEAGLAGRSPGEDASRPTSTTATAAAAAAPLAVIRRLRRRLARGPPRPGRGPGRRPASLAAVLAAGLRAPGPFSAGSSGPGSRGPGSPGPGSLGPGSPGPGPDAASSVRVGSARGAGTQPVQAATAAPSRPGSICRDMTAACAALGLSPGLGCRQAAHSAARPAGTGSCAASPSRPASGPAALTPPDAIPARHATNTTPRAYISAAGVAGPCASSGAV